MSKGRHYETLSQSLGTSGLKRMVMIVSTAKLMSVVVLAAVMRLLTGLPYFNCASYQICIMYSPDSDWRPVECQILMIYCDNMGSLW